MLHRVTCSLRLFANEREQIHVKDLEPSYSKHPNPEGNQSLFALAKCLRHLINTAHPAIYPSTTLDSASSTSRDLSQFELHLFAQSCCSHHFLLRSRYQC
jgi:hypothetical protein